MFTCGRCGSEARDGVHCTHCLKHFDFPCAGITEAGYRRLGERKQAAWKCNLCRVGGVRSVSPANPVIGDPSTGQSLAHSNLDDIHSELRKLSEQMTSLPWLVENVKSMQADLSELKAMKNEMIEVKTSLNYVHTSVDHLTARLSEMDREIQALQKTKTEISMLEQRLNKFEIAMCENEQRSRLNNIEIKGVPVTSSENLFNILFKIGKKINCEVIKEQINYIARVPQRNSKDNKNIIVSLHSRYLRDDFVSAAKKMKTLTTSDLGLNGDRRIYVNDHLTLENKQLLNRAKSLAKEKEFSYIWVKNCKILVRKNATSPTHIIKSESDLKKLF